MPAPFRYYLPGREPASPDDIPVPQHAIDLFLRRLPADRPSDKCWALDGRTGLDSAYRYVSFNAPSGIKVAMKAHRLSFSYFKGPIPDGLLVLHRCNNKSCVNPLHLYCGTELDNARDRWAWEAAEAAAGRVTATVRFGLRMKAASARRRAMRCETVAA